MQYCAAPHCSKLVTRGRCPDHARQADIGTRGTAQQRGYDSRWATYSKGRLQRFPICGMREGGVMDPVNSRCAREGLTTPATCTDHIIPLRQGGAMWDLRNHLSLCHACNTLKAVTIERGKVSA